MSYRKTIYLNFISSVKVFPLSEIKESTQKHLLLYQSTTDKSDTKTKMLVDSKTDRKTFSIQSFFVGSELFLFSAFFLCLAN